TRVTAGLVEHRAQIPGFTMPYLDGGRGEPLVLVHGFAADKDNFSRIARYLTRHVRVIAPDLPGFGDATRDPLADYRIADQVARLRAFLQSLGVGPVHLAGSSMGGFIVAQYAATYPDDVASLWLLDAAGTQAAFETEMIRQYLSTGAVPLLVRIPADFQRLLDAVTFRNPLIPHSLRHVLARRAVADFDLHTRIFRQIGQDSPTLETSLPMLRAPTLIVWGDKDRVLSPSAAAVMGQLIPHSQVIVMRDVGHLPMLECPGAAARDYLRFRATLPAKP
ncbi:MAG TPA: alpha/beta hydrolase, partial [Steroidobacteraceae bacterium]|nr:alpha/beta hydrolase [Steroidobacteraceae bacterium]